MIRVLALGCLFAVVNGLRRGRREESGSFKTRTDVGSGACAAHVVKGSLPIYFPLLCTGDVRDLTIKANAAGEWSPRLRLSINGDDKGYREFPFYPANRTWTVSHGSLPAGINILKYTGDRLSFNWLEVEGSGGSCTFEDAPGYDVGSWTNAGMDVLYRVIGSSNVNFSSSAKRQLHFALETYGSTDDGSISSTVVSDGVWEWFLQYSKQQETKDDWLSRYYRDGDMYLEARIEPKTQVSLNQLPGRNGEEMVVCEPCNTVSNYVFAEIGVWTGCKGLPFTSEEMASLLVGYSALSAGSAFFHASCTRQGQRGDVFTMEQIMYQTHQLMVKSVLDVTSSALTAAERNTIWTVDTNAGDATNKAREITAIFRQPYDIMGTKNSIDNLGLPGYMLTIITTVVTFAESLRGNWPFPFSDDLVGGIIDALMDALGGNDVDYVTSTFRPAVRKAFDGAKYCGDRYKIIGRFLSFVVTFVDAFVYQEEQIEVPQETRDELIALLAQLQLNTTTLAEMNNTWDLYNGQISMCDARSPHAKWHEYAAQGFLHIQNVASLLITDVRTSC